MFCNPPVFQTSVGTLQKASVPIWILPGFLIILVVGEYSLGYKVRSTVAVVLRLYMPSYNRSSSWPAIFLWMNGEGEEELACMYTVDVAATSSPRFSSTLSLSRVLAVNKDIPPCNYQGPRQAQEIPSTPPPPMLVCTSEVAC